nr:nucleotide-binding alpha-beta plait domain-containing protein [Tanacetum cinerariifolium]
MTTYLEVVVHPCGGTPEAGQQKWDIKGSKEDDVMKISTTMFVTNFPDESTAKELFHACSVYGHVVDSYIPNKRAKNGFGVSIGDSVDKSPAMILDDECLVSSE